MNMPTTYRVKPSIWMGAIFAVALFFLPAVAGLPFAGLPKPLYMLISTALVVVIAVGIAAALGWLRPLLFEPNRVKGVLPVLLAFGPVLYIVYCTVSTDWAVLPTTTIVLALLSGLYSGVWEELMFRGALLIGIRGNLKEVWVAVITAVAFGLLHSINFVAEPGAETGYQVVYAIMVGFAFYAIRRVTGSIFFCMVVHMLNNAMESMAEHSNATIATLASGFSMANIIFIAGLVLGIISAVVVIRRTPQVSLLAPTTPSHALR
ncbi:MAG: CPBP family intramembrane glutamic endopeptidase [Rhodoglobus sp.]|nr:CPBP family intramembrane glutamic endopeptidase [Rhodoglobus sp.]